MNKKEIVSKLAETTNLSKTDTQKVLDGFLDIVMEEIQKGQDITLVGFGTFSASERAARSGRNPKTGETIEIPATKVPKFKPGKTFKDKIKS